MTCVSICMHMSFQVFVCAFLCLWRSVFCVVFRSMSVFFSFIFVFNTVVSMCLFVYLCLAMIVWFVSIFTNNLMM